MTPKTTYFSLLVLVLAIFTTLTIAQNCYFPNGDFAPDSSPCFGAEARHGGVSVCCPLNWECETNGLCYLDAEDYYGRYSCTDQSWTDDECPQYCTQNGTAPGNEAILHCEDGHWCCDGNRSSDCCNDDDAEVIDVPEGKQEAFITQTPGAETPTGNDGASSTQASSSTTSTTSSSHSSSTTSSTSSTPSPIPTTITTRAATTNSDGLATTVIVTATSIYTPADALPLHPSATASPSSHSKTPLIAGLAAGIPLALLALSILAFLLYRRRRNSNSKPTPSSSTSTNGDLKYMYNNTTPDGQPPEIDSYPVVAGTKPGHKSYYSQISELSGSEPSSSGQANSNGQKAQSPAVSSMHSGGAGGPYSPMAGFGGGGFGSLGQVREEKEIEKEMAPVELSAEPVVRAQDFAEEKPTSIGAGGGGKPGGGSAGAYPGHVPYRYSLSNTAVDEIQAGEQKQRQSQYVAYRPSSGNEKGDVVETVKEGDTDAGAAQEETPPAPQSPAKSPRADIDHGTLGAGGLRIVNQ